MNEFINGLILVLLHKILCFGVFEKMIETAALLVIGVLLLSYFYLTRKFDFWKDKNIPYLKPLPLFGNFIKTFTFQQNIGEAIKDIYKSTDHRILGFFIVDEPYLLIRDPELIKLVLVKDFHYFPDRTITRNVKADPVGSNVLFIIKGQEWKNMRRKLSPVFSSAKIKAMYPLLSEAGADLIHYLKTQKQEKADVKEVTAKYTTDAISSTAFGINANCFKDENAEFRQASRRIFNFAILERAISTTCYFISPALVKLFGLRFVDKESSDFLMNAFWRTINQREEMKFVRNDMVDIMIELRKQSDFENFDDKIVAQAVGFFIGGYETTSSTTTFALYELALHPEIQSKLRDEIVETMKKQGFTYDSIQGMGYLDLVVKETLRKYPIVPFLDRKCSADYELPGTNVTLKKNSSIFISLLGLHYDEKYWSKPDEFDPTRFTEENSKSRPPFVYMPFGEGPRICIGARYGLLTSKSILARILSEFEVELDDKRQNSIIFDKKGFILAPDKQLILKFKKL